MEWREIEVFTTKEGIEPLTGCLNLLGINGFVVNDSEEFKAFTEDKNANWDYIDDSLLGLKERENSVTCYIPANEQGDELLEALKAELKALKARDAEGKFGRLEFKENTVKEEDWANNWKEYFKPFNVGVNLLVTPSWIEADLSSGRLPVYIDPESSFGTGQHDTTKMCLEFLDGMVCNGDRVLDLGCGSGILSVAAAKLGAGKLTLVDIDANSVKIAGQNLEKNSVPSDIAELFVGNVCEDKALREKIGGGYDIVCANIVADVLIAMSDYFMDFLDDDGTLLLSGIIDQREDEVYKALKKQGFVMSGVKKSNDWLAILCTSPKNSLYADEEDE